MGEGGRGTKAEVTTALGEVEGADGNGEDSRPFSKNCVTLSRGCAIYYSCCSFRHDRGL